MSERSWDLLRRTVLENRWIPKVLHGKFFPGLPQALFLTNPADEVLYGGAAGGGKSTAALAGGLQYVDTPGYNGVILRRTFSMLELPDGLIPMSHAWLGGSRAKWNQQKHQWAFPSGATLSFGFLDNDVDKYKYQSAAFQYVNFEEVTQFAESMYTYLFSRIRRVGTLDVPLRMRGTTNPGGVGHAWVKRRFRIRGFTGSVVRELDPALNETLVRVFIPAKMSDNPGLDHASYRRNLARLDPVTRAQLERGDWDVSQGDGVFNPDAVAELEKHVLPGESGSFGKLADERYRWTANPQPRGRITIYEHPRRERVKDLDTGTTKLGPYLTRYVMGFDTGLGLGKDYDYCVVLDRNTGAQVAEAAGHWGDRMWAEILAALYWYYGEAFVVGERQVGLPIMRRLYDEMGVRYQYFHRREETPGRRHSDGLGHHKAAGDRTVSRLQEWVAPWDLGQRLPPRLTIRSTELHRQVRAHVWVPTSGSVQFKDATDGQLKASAPAGDHDDGVSALEYAVQAMEECDRFPAPVRDRYGEAEGAAGRLLDHDSVLNPKPEDDE